jgi:hypothetical protein
VITTASTTSLSRAPTIWSISRRRMNISGFSEVSRPSTYDPKLAWR